MTAPFYLPSGSTGFSSVILESSRWNPSLPLIPV